MKNILFIVMCLLFPLINKVNKNVNIVKFDNKIYYLGNDTIGWCAFDNDGVLLYRITDIILGNSRLNVIMIFVVLKNEVMCALIQEQILY